MTKDELITIQDSAADSALKARERIEAAIDSGELPVWVMDALTVVERSSLLYGATSAQLRFSTGTVVAATPARLQ